MKGLTERQQLVVSRIGEGKQIKEVAAELGVSMQCAHKHCVVARRKLGLPSHAALIRYAAIESVRI